MPVYDIRCRTCGTTFEISRPMAAADEPAPCPQGHPDTVRLLPAIPLTGRGVSSRAASPARAAAPAGGGCCGGGCCG